MTNSLIEHKEQRKNQERDKTSTIMTRWYRPPEVIITDKNYNKAIDIYSLGCILAELLACSSVYSRSPGFDVNKRYLHRGKSCYPISPLENEDEDECKIDKNDQLFMILNHLPNLNPH